MIKKIKVLIIAFLFLCCIGGCGKNEENADSMEGIQMQEQEDAGNPDKIQAPDDEAGVASGEADSKENTSVFFENGEPVENIITNQSFEVELDDWETVTFVSIAPKDKKGAPRFVLAKGDAVVYVFPEDNPVKSDDFVEVSAVSFADYNEDGKKDVIVLIRYRNGSAEWNEARIFLQENSDNMFYIDYPDLESYRKDAPTEKGPAFYRDSLLEEYLMKQRLTDTVSSVMGTWTGYIDYVDALSGYSASDDKQLALLAKNRDIWAVPIEYADEKYCFTIRDLNYDGLLEIIVANQGGTGHYTYSKFYQMDRDGNLKELETSFTEGDSQPDIIQEQMTVYTSFSAEGMRDYYIVYDDLKVSPDYYIYRISSLCMTDDYILETPLASQTVTYEGEDHAAHTVSEDCNGNALTEEEFQAFPETYYSNMGLSKKTVSLYWVPVSELAGKNDVEAEELLRQAYQGL